MSGRLDDLLRVPTPIHEVSLFSKGSEVPRGLSSPTSEIVPTKRGVCNTEVDRKLSRQREVLNKMSEKELIALVLPYLEAVGHGMRVRCGQWTQRPDGYDIMRGYMLPSTWNLTGGPFKRNMVFAGPLSGSMVIGGRVLCCSCDHD